MSDPNYTAAPPGGYADDYYDIEARRSSNEVVCELTKPHAVFKIEAEKIGGIYVCDVCAEAFPALVRHLRHYAALCEKSDGI